MRYTIAKQFTFHAAHQLPLHEGKCRNLHGHSYRVEVAITADELIDVGSSSGMVMDFGDLSYIWKEYLEPHLDHQYLNETLPIEWTTAELIAGWILTEIKNNLDDGIEVAVQVWETPTSWAAVTT